MPSKSKELQDLQDTWYKKLADSGFKDAEQDETYLKWSTNQQIAQIHRHSREFDHELKTNYFRLVGFFLHDHKFTSKVDKFVWSAHAEGKSQRETAKMLLTINIKVSHFTVFKIINRLKAIMYKRYSTEEAND